MMVWADEWLLLVLVPAALLWLGLWVAWQPGRRRSARAVLFSSVRRFRDLMPSPRALLRQLVVLSRVVVVALLVTAMARPQTGRKETEIRSEGIDIMLAIDTSGSMQALDLDADRARITDRRNRLEVVKDAVAQFARRRTNDQIGMIVFGAEAFTQCPLTLDQGIVASFLERVHIGMAGDATAIGNAIGIAVKRLQNSRAKSKVIILLTDGRQNAGALSPKKAAEIAKTFGIKVYTIGAGTRGEAPFLVDTLFGPKVQMQEVSIDEQGLQEVAALTGGAYFRAEDRTGLEHIYEQIDALERSAITATKYLDYTEWYPWLLGPALVLLLVERLLLGTWLRRLP